MNLLSDQGLRLDGRRPDELRNIRCKLGVFSQADGSAYIEQGNTKVLATVYGPHQVKKKEYSILYFLCVFMTKYLIFLPTISLEDNPEIKYLMMKHW